MSRLKILLIAGHGAGDPGACSSYGTEATETRRVLSTLKYKLSAFNCDVSVYPTNRDAYQDIKNGCLQVNFANFDYVFEIHFNSAANASANGVEIFITSAESGYTVEQAVITKMESLGFSNRGVKREDFCVIRTAKRAGTSAALIETCFINNLADMNNYNSKFERVCEAMANGIAEGFELSKSSTTPPSQPTVPTPPPTSKPKYYVRTSSGKQLSAHNVYEYAVDMAKRNSAGVYDINGKLLVSYFPQAKKYLNLKPHMNSWRIYRTNVAPVSANAFASLSPATYGGLSYEILGNPQTDVYTINTSMFGKVNIYAPRDNDSTITTYPVY